MNIFDNFIGMLTLKDKSCVDATKIGFGGALLNFVIAAVAVALGSFWLSFNIPILFGSVLMIFILLTLAWFVLAFIFWLFAKIFGGKGAYMPYYNGSSHLALWLALGVVPFIGPVLSGIGSLWGVVMNVWLTKNYHKLPMGKAIAAVLIPYVIYAILAMIVAAIIAALFATLLTTVGLGALGMVLTQYGLV
jgi:hypothetical protein